MENELLREETASIMQEHALFAQNRFPRTRPIYLFNLSVRSICQIYQSDPYCMIRSIRPIRAIDRSIVGLTWSWGIATNGC